MTTKDWQPIVQAAADSARVAVHVIQNGSDTGVITATDKNNAGLTPDQITYRMRRVMRESIKAGLDCDGVRTWGRAWTQPGYGAQITVYGWAEQ